MPLERAVVNAVIESMQEESRQIVETLQPGDVSNPVRLTFRKGGSEQRLIIHARRLTPQWREGEDPSSHGRPPGEFHVQMIFDGDQRGRGMRNFLRHENDALTLLLGYYLPEDEYIFVAYDPSRHAEYAYSKSLQVKQQTLEKAERFHSESALDEFIRTQKGMVQLTLGRIRLPRIFRSPFFWPPSERIMEELGDLAEAYKAGEIVDPASVDLSKIEGDDLSAVWEPICAEHPMFKGIALETRESQ